MKRATVISLVGHGVILAWAVFSFSRALDTPPLESMAVDVISSDQLSKVTLGVEKAPQAEKPKPIVDQIAEPTPPPEDPTASVDKKVQTASAEQTNPEPSPPVPEPKPAVAPPEAKVETKTPEKKEPDQKVDPIAETLKKEEAKKPEKKAEVKPQPEKKPEPQQSKLDLRQTKALIDKHKPTRLASAGSELNRVASLGAPQGREAVLSQNELDALKRRLQSNWNIPANTPEWMKVRIYISLRRDGTLAARPEIETSGSAQLRESAVRAIMVSQPFDMLRPSTYETWQELDITFTPRDLR